MGRQTHRITERGPAVRRVWAGQLHLYTEVKRKGQERWSEGKKGESKMGLGPQQHSSGKGA